MKTAMSSSASGPKALVVQALENASGPLNAYQVAKATGVTPMQAGRTLLKLAAQGLAQSDDERATANDLAAAFSLRPQAALA